MRGTPAVHVSSFQLRTGISTITLTVRFDRGESSHTRTIPLKKVQVRAISQELLWRKTGLISATLVALKIVLAAQAECRIDCRFPAQKPSLPKILGSS